MALSELVMEMSSPEACFQASSKEECFIELKAWRSRMGVDATNKNLTILNAVNVLHDSAIMATPTMRRTFSHLSVLNMFTIIHALYLQVYRFETSAIASLGPAETAPITNALWHWQDLWPSQARDAELADLAGKENGVSTMWQRSGFIKYAPEYWLAAHLTLERILKHNTAAAVQVSGSILDGEDGDMVEVQRLIAGVRDGSAAPIQGTDGR